MACFKPLEAWRGRDCGPSGKRLVLFDRAKVSGFPERIELPCGQCIGCRLERSRQWAMRCVHEASLHADNSFLTLTYSPENVPGDGSLNKAHFQKFMKRLRRRFSSSNIRYFHCGEYGEKFSRPHYHACVFGFDFPDKELFRVVNGQRLYVSAALSDLWPFGFSTVGAVTFESAAYVARYVMKKVTGPDADKHYDGRQPEYVTMSRRPGIGRGWFDKFSGDVYPSDEVVINGKVVRPPKFYDSILEVMHNDVYELIKSERVAKAFEHRDNNTRARLRVREICTEARVSLLRRELEEGC